MPRIDWESVGAVISGLGAIDGFDIAVGHLDQHSSQYLARRLSYFLLRPVEPKDVSAILAQDARSEILSLEKNRRGLTVVQCIEQVTAVMGDTFGPAVRSAPVPALVRYGALSETKAWRRADGFDLVELFIMVERAVGLIDLGSKGGFACEFPILEMGHAFFLYDDLTAYWGHSSHIARAMHWPKSCPEDGESIVHLVLECMAVVLGLPFDLCRRSVPLAKIMSYCLRSSRYYGIEQRVGALVCALSCLWSRSDRRKAKLLVRTCEQCLHRGEDVAGWVRLWE